MHFTCWIVLTNQENDPIIWLRPGKWVWWSMAWLHQLFHKLRSCLPSNFGVLMGCFTIFNLIFTHIFQMGWQKNISNYSDGGFKIGDSRWVSVVMKKIGRGIPVPPHEELQNLCQKWWMESLLDFTPLRHLHIFIAGSLLMCCMLSVCFSINVLVSSCVNVQFNVRSETRWWYLPFWRWFPQTNC